MRLGNYDWEIISCDSETTIRKLLRAIQKLRLGNPFVRLINYGSKIMDHMFILKGIGWLAALKGLSIFAIVCFDNVQGMLVRWVGVGWASLALARHHDGTWGGVGLITFLGTCAPTWCYVRDGVGWGGVGLTTFPGTCTPTWCYVRDGVGWGSYGSVALAHRQATRALRWWNMLLCGCYADGTGCYADVTLMEHVATRMSRWRNMLLRLRSYRTWT